MHLEKALNMVYQMEDRVFAAESEYRRRLGRSQYGQNGRCLYPSLVECLSRMEDLRSQLLQWGEILAQPIPDPALRIQEIATEFNLTTE